MRSLKAVTEFDQAGDGIKAKVMFFTKIPVSELYSARLMQMLRGMSK
jgi:hypothetical protein